MKLKKLKKVKILGHTVLIQWDENFNGGAFALEGDVTAIQIGCEALKTDPSRTHSTLMHELSELIHVLLCSRYDDMGGNGYKFFMSHKEFQNHNRVLCETYMKFFK
jgi:hypothetical protein